MASPLLQVTDLHLRFPAQGGQTAVDVLCGIDLAVSEGETLALVGPSGGGKTLTARSIMGLMPAGAQLSGAIEWRGRDLLKQSAANWRRLRGPRLAMVMQEPLASLNPVLRVGEQIAETLRYHLGLDGAAAWRRAVALFSEARLPNAELRARLYPHQLSGGMRQRVLIAAALACDPELLIADEPTTALDVTVQSEILQLLDQLSRRRGMALLYITHDLALVPQVARRLAVIDDGRIVEDGPAEEVLAAPRHACSRALVAARQQRSEGSASEAPATLLEARGLVVEWPLPGHRWWRPQRVIRPVAGVDLSIAAAESLGLAGETGCGKTTLARVLVGQLEPTEGSVRIAGIDHAQLRGAAWRRARRQIQLVFQDPQNSLNPRLSVDTTLAEAVAAGDPGLSKADLAAAVSALLAEVDLPASFGRRFPHAMSGGQRQRVAIARCLAVDPLVLVADEPTSSLDAIVANRLLGKLAELQGRRGLALLLISHDLDLLGRYCARIAVMYRGLLVEIVPAAALAADCRHPYTRRLLRATPTLVRNGPRAAPEPDTEVLAAVPLSELGSTRGCPYRVRCRLAKASCGEALPELRDLGSGHLLRCPFA